jgi:hypothetical protein
MHGTHVVHPILSRPPHALLGTSIVFTPTRRTTHYALSRAASIAFVTYAKWAAAEEAIKAMHDHMPGPTAKHGLVVKFADGKPPRGAQQGGAGGGGAAAAAAAGAGVGMKRGFESEGGAMHKRPNMGMVRLELPDVRWLIAARCRRLLTTARWLEWSLVAS